MGNEPTKRLKLREKLGRMLISLPNWLFGTGHRVLITRAILDIGLEDGMTSGESFFASNAQQAKRRRHSDVHFETVKSCRELRREIAELKEQIARMMEITRDVP